MKTAAAPQVVRSDLVDARRIERSPRDIIDRSIGEELASRIRHRLPVLDERGHRDGFTQHGKAAAMDPRMRPSEMADPRGDEGSRRSDCRGKTYSPTDYARWLTLEPYHSAVLSRYDHPHAYGRDSSGERIGGGFYRRQFDEADQPTPKQEGDRVSSSTPAAAAGPRARPEPPSSESLTTGRQSASHPKMLLGTSSDKTVYQRPKGRGRRTRDEKRKTRSGGREARAAKQHTVSAPCCSAFGPQRRPQNGAERHTENLDLITFDDGAKVGGFDAAAAAARTPPPTRREIPGFPSNQVPQEQKSSDPGATRYGMQERWNSYVSAANVDADMDVGYRFERTAKDNAERERRCSNVFAELQSVHEEITSDAQSLFSDHDDQQRHDDHSNRSELTKVVAFQRSSNHDPSSYHDPSSLSARLMRKDTFSGLSDLFDDGTIETNSTVGNRAIRSQGGTERKGNSSFKSQTPRTEKEEEKRKQVESVSFSGMSRFGLKRSVSDGAMSYPEAKPSNRHPVPDGFVSSLAANASDSWETVSSCASKTELIPYNESLQASYAEPFAAATTLDSIHNIPAAGRANVFELKVPILCPSLRRSVDPVEDFIAEFPEDASSQNNSLPDGRHFASIPDRFPTYLTSRPIVVGFQMKERDVSPRGFRDSSFGRTLLLDDHCLNSEDRSIQLTTDAFCRIPPPEQSAATMSPVLLSPGPQFSDGHAQSPRNLPSHRYIPTYVTQQQADLDGPWTLAAAAEVVDDCGGDDYWQSDYTDPCLCLHGDLMRGSVERWETSNDSTLDNNGRLRRRSRTQRRPKPEKRRQGPRSTYTTVKPLEDPRLMEEVFRNVDSAGHNNNRAPQQGGGASNCPVTTVPSPRPPSNREVVPLTMEGRSRPSGVDNAARPSTTQERSFDGIRMRCPGIEIVTSEDERRSAINAQRTVGNATNHGNSSARNVDGVGHVQVQGPRGERATAGESKGAAQTQTDAAEEHKRKLEERMRMLGVLQAVCLVLAIGAYVLLYLIYSRQ